MAGKSEEAGEIRLKTDPLGSFRSYTVKSQHGNGIKSEVNNDDRNQKVPVNMRERIQDREIPGIKAPQFSEERKKIRKGCEIGKTILNYASFQDLCKLASYKNKQQQSIKAK